VAALRLSAKLTQEPGRLVIDYQLTNTRAGALFAYDQLLRIAPSGVSAPGPTLAYAMLAGQAQVTAGKFLVPIPRGMRVEAPEMPLLSRVEPGATHTGQAVMALPLMRSLAYAEPGHALPPRPIQRLRFVIGYVDMARVPGRDAAFLAMPEPFKGLFRLDYGNGIELQEFVEAGFALDPAVDGKF
jgi:hypothetical protein